MEGDRVKAIQDWPEPTKLREVQEFLGFANFYRRFIRNYSRIAKGLTDLLKKSPGPFRITDMAKESFQNIQTAFCSSPVLRQFDDTKQIFVEPDASVYAIGAILSQEDENGRKHPVAYYSKKLTPEESRYRTPDQELLAVVYSMKHWRHFLEGARHQVIVLSDHNNLRWFNTTTKLSRRQVGLWLKLSKFDYVIRHRSGITNPADKLSRRADYMTEEPLLETPFLNLASIEPSTLNVPLLNLSATVVPETIRTRYAEAIAEDRDALGIISIDPLPDGWSTSDGIVYFNEKIYVPPALRVTVLEICHDNPLAGHFGQKRTIELVQRQFAWPGLSTFVKEYVKECYSCRRNKHSTHKAYGLLHPHPHPEAP